MNTPYIHISNGCGEIGKWKREGETNNLAGGMREGGADERRERVSCKSSESGLTGGTHLTERERGERERERGGGA